jgi:hypothetical protein
MPSEVQSPAPASRLRRRANPLTWLRRGVPAWVVSLVTHGSVLVALALYSSAATKKPETVRIDTRIQQERAVPEFTQVLEVETKPSETNTNLTNVKVSGVREGGGSTGAAGKVAPVVNDARIPAVKVAARLGMGDLPSRGDLDLNVQVKGEDTVVVADQGGAFDRLTREILNKLSKKKVLLIWLFDESLSMKDDQQDVRDRLDKVYAELGFSGKAPGDALETVVLSYGKDLHVQTERPTSELSKIREAIDKIPVDKTGEEWPCKYVIEVTKRYAQYFRQGSRTIMLVIPTDESGERAEGQRKESDGAYIEDAVAAANRIRMPIYVIGRQAIFGYPFAHLSYVDPETKDVYWPRITRGPESPDVECLQTEALHPRWDELSSGFGPYDLARMARDTGGIYFMLPTPDLQVRERHYDALDMKEYVPEFVSRKEYQTSRESSPLRSAIHKVIVHTGQISVPLHFSIEPDKLRGEAERAYKTANDHRRLFAEAYQFLKSVEKQRDREPSRRWQAHYDLLLGQMFAYQVKLFEYEYFLRDFVSQPQVPKTKPDKDSVVYWDVGHANHKTRSWAPDKFTKEPRELAERLLQQVIDRHPGTPWAARAQQELSRGFSVRIAEGRHSRRYGERAHLVPKY